MSRTVYVVAFAFDYSAGFEWRDTPAQRDVAASELEKDFSSEPNFRMNKFDAIVPSSTADDDVTILIDDNYEWASGQTETLDMSKP